MLGVYQNFPENVHHLAFFNYQNPTKSIQRAVLHAIHKLNNETFDVCELTPYLKQNLQVGFEFGVADGFDFVFLGQNELEECL
ncbi:MAG: hypothetical protein NWF03_07860, partial [Candidatus Bathyarchaeota archaeon]|nr:hypothetical protein [Candidatus Bathyarchaeota archaeon]